MGVIGKIVVPISTKKHLQQKEAVQVVAEVTVNKAKEAGEVNMKKANEVEVVNMDKAKEAETEVRVEKEGEENV